MLLKIKRINGKIGRNIGLIIISTFQRCSKRRRRTTLFRMKINGKIGRNIGLIIIIIANNRSRNRLQRSFNVVSCSKRTQQSRRLMEKLEETNNNNNNRNRNRNRSQRGFNVVRKGGETIQRYEIKRINGKNCKRATVID